MFFHFLSLSFHWYLEKLENFKSNLWGMTLNFKAMSIHLRLEDCSFLLWFGVSACFLTSLAPPEAQERSKLQMFQWNLYWWSLIDEKHLVTNENYFFNSSEYLVLYFIFLAWVAMLKSSQEKKILLKVKLLFKK